MDSRLPQAEELGVKLEIVNGLPIREAQPVHKHPKAVDRIHATIKSTGTGRRQRGIAILSVLVIATLVVTLATLILARQSRSIRQTDNFQSLERAWQYALTMEQFAALQLQLDAQENQYDALTDRWAQEWPIPVINDESGATVRITGKLEDMQGRLNLNNLVLQQQTTQPNQNQDNNHTRAQQQPTRQSGFNNKVRNILQNFVTDAGMPATFTDAIVDWVDDNNQPIGVGGAEQDFYLSGALPYLPANMPFAAPSEVRLVRLDMQDSRQKDQALKRFLGMTSTLPFFTTINPNTASKAVLQALRLNETQIAYIMEKRTKQQAFTNKGKFVGEMLFDSNQFRSGLTDLFDVNSQYFRLTGEVSINRARVFVNSLLFRNANGQVRVIMRQFSRVDEATTMNAEDDVSNTPANTY